jgi:hypothetical protein
MQRPARSELPVGERLDRRAHVRVVRRAVGGVDAVGAGGVRQRPPIVGVVPEPEARHLRVAAGPEDRVPVDPVEHPASQAHRLEHEHGGVAGRCELRGRLGERVLLDERERVGLLEVDETPERLHPGIFSSWRSSYIEAPFCVMKHRIAINDCAMSATGISSRLPGRFTHQVLWPSM